MVKRVSAKMVKEELIKVLASVAARKDDFVMHPGVDFTRNRMCSFEKTMHVIMAMGGGSLKKELFDLYPNINERMTSSALVQQRGKIKPEAFLTAFNEFNTATINYDTCDYNGYNVFAVDGTAVSIARNEETETHFEQGYNQFHLVALYDICNKTYRDCVIQPRPSMNENAALKEMVNRTSFPQNTIVLCDRLFGDYSVYETIKRNSAYYLIRVPNDYSTETKSLPLAELDVDRTIELRTTQTNKDKEDYRSGKAKFISGPSKFGKPKKNVHWEFESPCKISMRIVRFQLSSGEYETIVTSLDRFSFPIEEIKKLYAMRWGIETSFRELKYDSGLSHLHARKEDSVLQEVYAHLLMYNYCSRIITHVGLTKSHGKHQYKVNFKIAFYICRRFFWNFLGNIEAEIAAHLEPIRPGRADNRKLIPKTFVAFVYRVA